MKRVLSLMLAFAMILSMVPNVFATETGEDQLPSDAGTMGSEANPEVLAELGWLELGLVDGDTDGYYYSYTAEADGTVAVGIDSITAAVPDENETPIVPLAEGEEEAVTGTIVLTNKTTGVSKESTGAEITVDVAEGDRVIIQITASAAATVNWYGTFTYPAGSEQNPIWLNIGENVLTIPAGATVYYVGRFGGMTMSAVGEGVTLEHNGTTYTLTAEAQEFACVQASFWDPCAFVITNDGEADATCTLTVNYPLGSMDNPAQLEMGANTFTAEEGSQGYYYTWTAEEAGTLTIEMPSDMGWVYVINNMTTYVYGDTQWSDSDPVANPAEIEVAAGDELQIMVNTYDPENPWTAPAGELTFYAYFVATPGTENNPLWLSVGENVLTIPAGATVYYAGRFGGMVMSAVGEGVTLEHNGTTYTLTAEAQTFACVQASFWDPCAFVITNDGEADATCTLTVNYPLGSMDNPAQLEMGANTFTAEEGSQGYYYTWTAEEAGTLTIEMPSDMGWVYVINNMTTYVYGDTQWSDSDPVANPAEIEVAAGDELQIMVNTYDPANEWVAPAGTLTFTASFTVEAPVEEPIVITQQPADQCVKVQTKGVFTVVAEGENLTYQWQQSTDGTTWTKSTFTGSKTNSLTVTCYSSRNNMQFRCVITDANGHTVTSKAATLSILVEDFRIVTQPTVQSGNIGDYLYYTVEANDAYTYRWEMSTDGGETWEKAAYTGYNTNTMKVKLYFSRVAFQFRCVIKDALGNTLITDEVGINVVAEAVVVTQQPELEIAAYGTNAYFQVEAENAVAYRWQVSTDGGETWANTGDNVTGYNTKAMGIKALNSRDGWLFRCALTDGHGNVSYSEAAELKVASFTKQPENQVAASGEYVTFSVAANYDVNYAWQYSTDGGETWQYASWTGADTAEMTVKVYASRSGWLFRCAITGTTSQPLYSNPVTLTVE